MQLIVLISVRCDNQSASWPDLFRPSTSCFDCRGEACLAPTNHRRKSWMAGTSPAMTGERPSNYRVNRPECGLDPEVLTEIKPADFGIVDDVVLSALQAELRRGDDGGPR